MLLSVVVKINVVIGCSVVALSLLMGLSYEKEAQAGPKILEVKGEVELLYDGCASGFPKKVPIDLDVYRDDTQPANNPVLIYSTIYSRLPYLYSGSCNNPDNMSGLAQEGNAITELHINPISKTAFIEYTSSPRACNRYYLGRNLAVLP